MVIMSMIRLSEWMSDRKKEVIAHAEKNGRMCMADNLRVP